MYKYNYDLMFRIDYEYYVCIIEVRLITIRTFRKFALIYRIVNDMRHGLIPIYKYNYYPMFRIDYEY